MKMKVKLKCRIGKNGGVYIACALHFRPKVSAHRYRLPLCWASDSAQRRRVYKMMCIVVDREKLLPECLFI